MKYNVKPIPSEKLIKLAQDGHSYRTAARVLGRDCATVKTYAMRLQPAVHGMYLVNGIRRKYTQNFGRTINKNIN